MKERFYRKCPKCNAELSYSSKKHRNRAEKINSICFLCSRKEVFKRPEVILNFKKMGERYRVKYSGEGNPFYGKKHTEVTKEILRKTDRSYTQTQEFKDKVKRPGKLNGMYGKSIYDVWVEKYGEIEANKKMGDLRKKRSINATGKNNSMYGKPAPVGSGNGWSGWYKGWYFRSLRGLSYMICVIEKKGYKWESAENKKYYIKYINFDGREKTYIPDFIINDKILVEIKPKKLMDTPTNSLKKKAAIEFCLKNGLEYRMVDMRIVEQEKLIDLFLSGQIILINRYKERLQKIIDKKRN